MDTRSLVRMGMRRLDSMARETLYLKAGLDWTLPECVHCVVIERCNYKCQYCHFWRLDKYEEMSIAEWKAALLSLKEFLGTCSVKFSGGEPFLKKGFVDLLEFCREQGIGWSVTTNGFAFESNLTSRVVGAAPTHIDISVDSPINEVNDVVRGAPGSLAKIELGMERLRLERDRAGQRFPIRVKPTITRLNFRSLPRFPEWAKKHGATSIDFTPVHSLPFWTLAMRSELWPTEQECAELRDVVEELISMQGDGAPIETAPSTMRSYADQFLGRDVKPKIPGPCRAGMRDLAISAKGDIVVCWQYEPIGNVRTKSVRDIWYGELGKKVRVETVQCVELGKECANSCKDHRSLAQDISRGIMMLRQARS